MQFNNQNTLFVFIVQALITIIVLLATLYVIVIDNKNPALPVLTGLMGSIIGYWMPSPQIVSNNFTNKNR